jgi:riboflavin transporter FmnP
MKNVARGFAMVLLNYAPIIPAFSQSFRASYHEESSWIFKDPRISRGLKPLDTFSKLWHVGRLEIQDF